MKISILIPCYNTEQYLGQCLDSICAQTLTDFEAICLNDGSTDGTREILGEYAAKDPRFKIIDKVNSGYGDSMNKGLAAASGEYIGIVEPDDWIEPDMFELLYAKARENDADQVRASYIFERKTPESRKAFESLPEVFAPLEHKLVFGFEPAIWSCLVKRSLLVENDVHFLTTPGASFQDTSFSFKCMLFSKRMSLITKPLYHYRIHENNSVKKGGKINMVITEWNESVRTLEQEGLLNEFSGYLYELQYHTYKWNYLRLSDDEAREFLANWKESWRALSQKVPLSNIHSLKKRLYAYLLLNFTGIFEFLFKRKR